jgi:hypothetical protein
MPYYNDTFNWAYMAISKDKDLAKLDDGKAIISEDGSALVYISDNKISLDVPVDLQILCLSSKVLCVYVTMMVKGHKA